MSYYKDIYNDFPLRCGKLWERMRRQTEIEKLEVTFMLMVASSGLVAPWEHLKHNALGSDKEDRHPAFTPGNDKHYEEILKAFTDEINCDLIQSSRFGHLDIKRWRLRTLDERNQIVGYLEQSSDSIGRTFEVRSARDLIKVFRNALAHNNFHALKLGNASEIDEITFFSEAREYDKKTKNVIGYNVISIPHVDFAAFLDAWFKLLGSLQHSKEHLRKVLIYAFQEEEKEQKSHGY